MLDLHGQYGYKKPRESPGLLGFQGILWSPLEGVLVETAGIEPASERPPHQGLHA